MLLGGDSVVDAGEGPVLLEVAAEEVTVLRVDDSLALVGPTSLLETEAEVTDSLDTGAGTTEVELVGAETGELSDEPGTVVVAVVAMVLSTTVVVSEATDEVVGDG